MRLGRTRAAATAADAAAPTGVAAIVDAIMAAANIGLAVG